MIQTVLSFKQLFFNLSVLDMVTACFMETRASKIKLALQYRYTGALISYVVVNLDIFFICMEFFHQLYITNQLYPTGSGKRYFQLLKEEKDYQRELEIKKTHQV